MIRDGPDSTSPTTVLLDSVYVSCAELTMRQRNKGMLLGDFTFFFNPDTSIEGCRHNQRGKGAFHRSLTVLVRYRVPLESYAIRNNI